MPLNVEGVFLDTALDALRDCFVNLTQKQQHQLVNRLITLCEKYAPGTFENQTELTEE